ncbi:endonuclease/exonuclease/phosphatase family protein [Pelagicoccus sp. NFK12]|uniref:Endonuclease/exonuclease/phosphatase family protein n=1 Tax=Pelagicoccus enzymogenes TaxID=2773457 RepID=A0A927FC64_9BACT|nr:endonuclease/exonuclease/phosphatase family protein [Pelagicoccus enzymogenes]MBD5782317.1 endonuclease/exonuclease/phosphatase family protein [Pelagicoccus enzymogenes]MDQ8199232.1 endonuclease/exonuclease/phosphatase family protein [Pelagicoccus enzymogenes]
MFKKTLLRLVKLLLGLVVLSIAWYGVHRLAASSTALNSFEIPTISQVEPKGDSLRVGAYNIAHGRGGKLGESNWTSKTRKLGEAHLLKIAKQIRAENLDVVVLNEVDFDASWSGGHNQARFIAENAGYRFVSTLTNIDIDFPFFDLKFGNAILSRIPLKDISLIELPPVKPWEPILAGKKNGMIATVGFSDKALRFVAIHIETRSYETRMGSAAKILEHIQKTNVPSVLLGDFNSQRSDAGSTVVDALLDQHGFKTDVDFKSWKTFPSEAPDRGIDWILVDSELSIRNSQAVPSALSDHLMVTAEIFPLSREPTRSAN